jgi:hypothetical protein
MGCHRSPYSEGRQVTKDEKHPIAAGFVALVGVGLVVGLLLGVVTLGVSRVLGLGGDDGPSTEAAGPSLYLPTPKATGATSAAPPTPSGTPTAAATRKPRPKGITLKAGSTSVSAMERIDLTGTYEGGNGAVLQVQRIEGKRWEDFPVTVSVSGRTFSTYVQTGRSGAQKFRVRDSDSGRVSNAVTVTVR